MEMSSQHDLKERLEHGGQSSSSVFNSINKKLDAISSSPLKFTIFKVHELLRRENEMAYEPEILAIGPYHQGKPRLQVMEDQKLSLLKKSLEQLGEDSDLNKCVEAMRSLEPKARRCYAESTNHVNEDEFVEMLLLDACFIIQFMRKLLTHDRTDPLVGGWVTVSLIRDTLIFENQIPLFVLQELFSLIRLPQEPIHFHDLAFRFLIAVFRRMFSSNISYNNLGFLHDVADHILGFLHDLLPVSNNSTDFEDDSSVGETNKAKGMLQHAVKLCKAGYKFIHEYCLDKMFHAKHDLNMQSIPSAVKLHAAGVQFRSKKSRSSPFEVSFKNGVMEIPTFRIGDSTESLYRNLIAYEQYSRNFNNHCVIHHIMLMDCLIDSAEDVALLHKCGIIRNGLGNDEMVSTIFNKLGNNVSVPYSGVHSDLFMEVNAYYGKRRHKWMAKLRRDYFNNPWALISFFAAFFLLLLTLTQTVFSIWGVL